MKTETDSLEMPSGERETERFLKDSLETERFLRDSLEIPRPRTPQPRIYYTCMNSWMQVGLLRDLLHLHELVIGNAAFISDSRVLHSRPPSWDGNGTVGRRTTCDTDANVD